MPAAKHYPSQVFSGQTSSFTPPMLSADASRPGARLARWAGTPTFGCAGGAESLAENRPTAGRPSVSGGANGYASAKNGVRMALVLALERRAPTLGPACIGRCPTCLKLHCVQLRLQAVEASERLAL